MNLNPGSIIYKDEYGKTVRFTVGKKSEGITEVYAYNKRNEFVNKIRLGEDPIAHKKKKNMISLDQVAKDHYEAKELHNRNNKVARAIYDNHISPVLGNRSIRSIHRVDIEKLQLQLSKKIVRKRTISKKTVNNILAQLCHPIFKNLHLIVTWSPSKKTTCTTSSLYRYTLLTPPACWDIPRVLTIALACSSSSELLRRYSTRPSLSLAVVVVRT